MNSADNESEADLDGSFIGPSQHESTDGPTSPAANLEETLAEPGPSPAASNDSDVDTTSTAENALDRSGVPIATEGAATEGTALDEGSFQEPAAREGSAAQGKAAKATPSPTTRWQRFNERFVAWRSRKKTRWAILLSIVAALSVIIGDIANVQAIRSWLPCPLQPENRIAEPYGIVVANTAASEDDSDELSNEDAERAEQLNQTLFDQVYAIRDPGKVGVSRTCDRDVQATEKRETYLNETRDLLEGELAVSLILTFENRGHVSAVLELDIGSHQRWNEAQEIAGYHKFWLGEINDSLDSTENVAQSSIAESLQPYILLLRAIANYARSDYAATIERVNETVADASASAELKKLAYVLKGNAEGRLRKTSFLERAEAAYLSAYDIDDKYSRAILGLAEIDYQRAITTPNSQHTTGCENPLSREASAYLTASAKKYQSVLAANRSADTPDAETRALYGLGRIHACQYVNGDIAQRKPAVDDFTKVINTFMSDQGKTWLQSAASGAFGDLALIYCSQKLRDKALSNYAEAYELAVDVDRRRAYRHALNQIGADKRYCS